MTLLAQAAQLAGKARHIASALHSAVYQLVQPSILLRQPTPPSLLDNPAAAFLPLHSCTQSQPNNRDVCTAPPAALNSDTQHIKRSSLQQRSVYT